MDCSNQEFDIERVCTELSAFEGGTIDLTKDEESGIAILVINNPTRKNSFTGTMMVQLRYALDELEQWTDGKALIIYGAGGSFCSGGNLEMVKQILNKKGGFEMSELMKLNFNRLQNLKLVTLCVVQGVAIGGGAELLTVCDFRLATRSSKIGFVHKKLAITTGWSGGVRLVNLVGKNKALDLMLFGRQLDAVEALNYGLINDILEDSDQIDEILTQAKTWLAKYIDGSNNTIKAIKTIVTAASNLSIEEALEVELKAFQSVWGAEAHKNAIKANIKHRS